MQIFISYASEDRSLAEEIQLALLGIGHSVFFDKTSLPAAGDYHSRIETAVKQSDLFIFLISSNSLATGSYAITELKYARSKWPHPKERVIPVMLAGTDWNLMPPYLKSVTILEPEGNIPAEVVTAVTAIQKCEIPPSSIFERESISSESGRSQADKIRKKYSFGIFAAVIGFVSLLVFASDKIWQIISINPEIKLPMTTVTSPAKKPNSLPILGGQTPLPTPVNPTAKPEINKTENCQEVTEYDYSKIPPESRVVKHCAPQ